MDQITLHDELIIIESGLFKEGDDLDEKEVLDESDQIPPFADTEVCIWADTG